MAIILGPDWNKLYDEGKCLDRGVPFTDEQQTTLFLLSKQPNSESKKREFIRKWRAEFEASKLQDPKQLQAHANAVAIQEAMKKAVKANTEAKIDNPDEKPTKVEENATDSKGEGIDYSQMSYNELKSLAKEKGIELKNPKKDDLIKALEGLGE